jgi:hypothetical protein
MVDTSRGYVDLKNLLADNVTRQIHPQTMRDVVESFAHPIAEDALDPKKLDTNSFSQVFNGGGITGTNRPLIPETAPDAWGGSIIQGVTDTEWRDQNGIWQPNVISPWAFAPDGWFDKDYHLDADDDNNSYGVDIDSAIMLPRGMYDIFTSIIFTPTVDWVHSNQRGVFCYVDQAEYAADQTQQELQDAVHNHTVGGLYDGYYNAIGTTLRNPNTTVDIAGQGFYESTFQYINDHEEPRPFILVFYKRNVLEVTYITNFLLNIIRRS